MRRRCCSRAMYLTGVYGGYFGAAQGILLLGILGVSLSQSLQRTNALKNVLAGLVNGVAGVYFVFASHVDWGPAGIIAVTSILGAQLGARYGRRLSPALLRAGDRDRRDLRDRASGAHVMSTMSPMRSMPNTCSARFDRQLDAAV